MKLTTGYKKPIASSGTDAQEQSSNNSYLLLAGGGHKALSELVSPADLTTALSNYVTIGSNQTITGVKTFSQAINADITGNASTATNVNWSGVTNKPVIGNGALHIKVNGSELTPEGGIFTANKGDNSTINITVPNAESIEESTLNKLGDKVVLKNGFTTELAKEMAEVLSEKNTSRKLLFKFNNPEVSLECNPDILSVNYIKVGDYYRLNIAGSFVLNGFNFYEQKIQDNYNPVLYSVISGTINNVELSAKKTGMLYFRLSDQQVSPNGAYGPVMFELSVFVESLSTDYNEGIYGELNITQFYQ